jgi:SPP1 Gp6-like portal protein
MPLSPPDKAKESVQEMLKWRHGESERLEKAHEYYRGIQKHPAVPSGMKDDVRRLAQISRVNIMGILISSVSQAMYVDGYRQPKESDEAEPWQVWQSNGMDKRQIGVHRAALTYGASYVLVLPGEFKDSEMPVLKGFSPRRMTVLYDDVDDWPVMALRAESIGDKWLYRLYDDVGVYTFQGGVRDQSLEFVEEQIHGVGVCPIVRFDNEVDLDSDNPGEVEPLIALQDQIDITTFSLLVAQHFGAFRQRWLIGWTAETENQLLKATASRVWSFEDSDVKVGDFEQTNLEGYLKSREDSLKHAATLSQTPVHELVGALINLSAEALVAAEAGHRRKVGERQTSFGESWEEVLSLAGEIGGFAVGVDAEVRWRDTESRAFSATVDALGKLVTMLGVPAQELWERIPGVTQQDVQRWKEAAEKSSAMAELTALLGGGGAENPPSTSPPPPSAAGAAA